MRTNIIYNEDCLEGMKLLDDNSVDSIVTDPPYELGFMGKVWDNTGIAYNIDLWCEALRVLKPGGHLLAFGGTRTYHRMACAIEDAGFEIRDQIQWIYGSGFPKSLNISKAIEKDIGILHETTETLFNNHHGKRDLTKKSDYGYKYEPQHESAKQWKNWGTALKPANEPICVARKPLSEKTVVANVLKWGTGGINIDGCRVEYTSDEDKKKVMNGNDEICNFKGNTYNYKDYEKIHKRGKGHNQGRFPANILLTHHPDCELIGTKKIKGDKGGIRKSGTELFDRSPKNKDTKRIGHADENGIEMVSSYNCTEGCPIKILDEQSGVTVSSGGSGELSQKTAPNNNIYGNYKEGYISDGLGGYSDKGGASRYFNQFEWQDEDFFLYTAKVSKSERTCDGNIENKHPCLSPDSLVVTNKGFKKIVNIKIGEEIYSEDGKFHKVINKTSHPYNENIYKIKVRGTNIPVYASHNHPFLIYEPIRKNKNIIDYNIKWKEAEEMNVGDYTMTPLLNIKEKKPKIEDKNYWFVMGLWLAEGSFQKAGHGENIYPVFSLHEKETELIERIKKISNKNISVYNTKENKGIKVIVFDNEIGIYYKKMCNKLAHKKELHKDILMLPQQYKEEFLNGYIIGDGSRIRNYIQVKTVSQHLTFQLKLLGESIGYIVNIYQCDDRNKETGIGNRKFKNKHIEYQVRFYNKNLNIQNRKPTKPSIIKYNGLKYRINYIKEITKEKYNNNIINLTIEGSPTFQTAIGMSHNTLKPLKLMKWLVRLVTRKGGIVLDPFCGSGTTCIAAYLEGMNYIGFEKEKEYYDIAIERLKYYKEKGVQQKLF
jgi:DNA modification methylase